MSVFADANEGLTSRYSQFAPVLSAREMVKALKVMPETC